MHTLCIYFEGQAVHHSQFMYCIYECYNMKICDTYNFWGTRTGSKLCQDVGQVVCRATALMQNGKHLLNDINEAIEFKNVLFFMKKMKSFELGTLDIEDKWKNKLIFQWNKTLIKRWLISENLEILIQFMDLYLNEYVVERPELKGKLFFFQCSNSYHLISNVHTKFSNIFTSKISKIIRKSENLKNHQKSKNLKMSRS